MAWSLIDGRTGYYQSKWHPLIRVSRLSPKDARAGGAIGTGQLTLRGLIVPPQKRGPRAAKRNNRHLLWGFRVPTFERGLGDTKLNGRLVLRGVVVSIPLTRGKGAAGLN